ncbi:MAG: hypothetical protein ABIP79_08120 [Chitinophagaceae bacterium]
MKKIFIFSCLLVAGFLSNAQVNYSGTYSYTNSIESKQIPKEITSVPGGVLVLMKMEGNTYRFWLDVLKGSPGFNRGETDGTIIFTGDTASFDNTFENAESPCVLRFQKKGQTITIHSQSTSFNCGFGNGVTADGVYRWKKQQVTLDNQWLKKQYPQASTFRVEDDQVELFRDESASQSFTPKLFFKKGDSFINITESEKNIYTEFIDAGGSFKYGWVRKLAIK